MLQWFRRRSQGGRRAGEIYGSVVAAARQPLFYSEMGVPDTPEGRFELVALHLFLALESLRKNGQGDRDLTQRVIEAFVTDMDDCMREMGVGDLTVPKKVKRAAGAFYERTGAYRQALAATDNSELEASLAKYVYDGSPKAAGGAASLAAYVRAGVPAHSLSADELEKRP